MSADQWSVCPRCLTTAEKREREQRAAVVAMYGSVSIEEFDGARDAIEEVRDEDYRTFREDFEVYGADEGTVNIDYSGRCTKCSLALSFITTRDIPDTQEAKDSEQVYDTKGRPVIDDD